jgi:hypothetical protein
MMNDMNSDSEREESFDFFDEELIKQIMLDKNGQPNQYKSLWEDDEENIENWTNVSIVKRNFKAK